MTCQFSPVKRLFTIVYVCVLIEQNRRGEFRSVEDGQIPRNLCLFALPLLVTEATDAIEKEVGVCLSQRRVVEVQGKFEVRMSRDLNQETADQVCVDVLHPWTEATFDLNRAGSRTNHTTKEMLTRRHFLFYRREMKDVSTTMSL